MSGQLCIAVVTLGQPSSSFLSSTSRLIARHVPASVTFIRGTILPLARSAVISTIGNTPDSPYLGVLFLDDDIILDQFVFDKISKRIITHSDHVIHVPYRLHDQKSPDCLQKCVSSSLSWVVLEMAQACGFGCTYIPRPICIKVMKQLGYNPHKLAAVLAPNQAMGDRFTIEDVGFFNFLIDSGIRPKISCLIGSPGFPILHEERSIPAPFDLRSWDPTKPTTRRALRDSPLSVKVEATVASFLEKLSPFKTDRPQPSDIHAKSINPASPDTPIGSAGTGSVNNDLD